MLNLGLFDWVADLIAWLKKLLADVVGAIAGWFQSMFAAVWDWLLSLLPAWWGSGFDTLWAYFEGYPAAKWALYLLAADYWVPVVLGAYAIRFLIRRLPIIG